MSSKKLRLISCTGALLFGLAILVTSLVAASQPFAYEASTAEHTTLYIGSRMLPDHALYPVAMVFDRVVLTTTGSKQKYLKQVSLAFERLESVAGLLQKDKPELAVSTLKKSQHYLLLALDAAQADAEISPDKQAYLHRALRAHIKRTRQLHAVFPAPQQQAVSDILVESISRYENI
ncbi:MAG: hypothetical protein GW946_04050 [Candidatus Pacebacteria bacterium]|nr:hypothetical protein [Candidatus Paceibacterota bacterium]PIR59958.1 MAG: hypothetical protein COU67_04215 [Candidatus Pacebacteria bacterium CG10_big_fil_rev_8_21_14_0_10_44_54]